MKRTDLQTLATELEAIGTDLKALLASSQSVASRTEATAILERLFKRLGEAFVATGHVEGQLISVRLELLLSLYNSLMQGEA